MHKVERSTFLFEDKYIPSFEKKIKLQEYAEWVNESNMGKIDLLIFLFERNEYFSLFVKKIMLQEHTKYMENMKCPK